MGDVCVCMCVCGHHVQQTGHQQGMVANPDHVQLNKENGIFPVPVRMTVSSRELGSAVSSRISPLTSRLNLVLAYGDLLPLPLQFPLEPLCALGKVISLLATQFYYRWRSLPRIHRHMTSSSGNPMGQSMCAPLSPHPLLVQ